MINAHLHRLNSNNSQTMKKYIPLVLRIIVAGILIQTLRFKFTGHPDSVYLFTQLGVEPYGRIATGIIELITGVLLLIPKTAWAGALVALGVMTGAIISHLTVLGIDFKGDGGTLFYTGIATWVVSAIIAYIYRKDIPFLKN